MTAHPTQSALRELRDGLRAHFSSRLMLLSLIGVSILLGVSGPFGTIDTLPALPRMAYWALVAWLTYGLGATVFIAAFPENAPPQPARIAVAVLGIGLGCTVILVVLNLLFLGRMAEGPAGIARLAGICVLVSGVVTGLMLVYRGTVMAEASTTSTPPILRRLPLDKRGALVSLAVRDHYVEVRTTKGREMLLMRLRDAISETAPADGMQVHRSYWVALPEVRAVRRRGDGALLTTSQGEELPVSRSYMPAIRDAGLLPG